MVCERQAGMNWFKLLISAISAIVLWWKETKSRKAKRKREAVKKGKAAIDEGNPQGVLDAFDEVNK